MGLCAITNRMLPRRFRHTIRHANQLDDGVLGPLVSQSVLNFKDGTFRPTCYYEFNLLNDKIEVYIYYLLNKR